MTEYVYPASVRTAIGWLRKSILDSRCAWPTPNWRDFDWFSKISPNEIYVVGPSERPGYDIVTRAVYFYHGDQVVAEVVLQGTQREPIFQDPAQEGSLWNVTSTSYVLELRRGAGPNTVENIERPQTLDDFRDSVENFAKRSLVTLRERYAAGGRNFSIEVHIDRGAVRTGPDGDFVALSVFQDMFYDLVNPEVTDMPYVSAYADHLTAPGGRPGRQRFDQNIMVYQIDVA